MAKTCLRLLVLVWSLPAAALAFDPAVSPTPGGNAPHPTLKAGITVEVPCLPPSKHLSQSPTVFPTVKPVWPKSVPPKVVQPKMVAIPPKYKPPAPPSTKQISAMATMLDRYRHPTKWSPAGSSVPPGAMGSRAPNGEIHQGQIAPQLRSPLSSSAAQTNKLPRWGDKDCLCHEGLQLFKMGRFMQAAAFYHKAGETMLKAWGNASTDVARARRGEAACYAAANRNQEACALYNQAIVSYISGAHGSAAPELQTTILDLSDSLRNLGRNSAATGLREKAPRLSALAEVDPGRALKEFQSAL